MPCFDSGKATGAPDDSARAIAPDANSNTLGGPTDAYPMFVLDRSPQPRIAPSRQFSRAQCRTRTSAHERAPDLPLNWSEAVQGNDFRYQGAREIARAACNRKRAPRRFKSERGD